MPPLPHFCGPTYQLSSPWAALDRTMNLYPELIELPRPGRGEALYLRSCPGLRPFLTLSPGPVRGLFAATNRRVFAVHGNVFSEIRADGTAVARGTVATLFGPVSMAENGLELLVVDGTGAQILRFSTNNFANIPDTDFPATQRVVFIDGYFLFSEVGTGRFGVTGLYQGTVVDPLDVATAEGSPDVTLSILAVNRELWLFGTRSTEVYFNSGAAAFPFSRIQGAYMAVGIDAMESAVIVDQIPYWLGGEDTGGGVVYRGAGYRAERVSTHAVETAIQRYARTNDARGMAIQVDGHWWYMLSFPTGNQTWVFDTTSGMWHERGSYDGDGYVQQWRVHTHCVGHGMHLLGDRSTGEVFQLDPTWYWDGPSGTEMPRIRRAPVVEQQGKFITHHRLRVFAETGVGLDGGVIPGMLPEIRLRYSDTFGQTWSNELSASLGALGKYQPFVEWRRLGRTRARCYETTVSDPVNVVLTGASLNDPL